MPFFTMASAIWRTTWSSTLRWNLFQLFQPMGGVCARPFGATGGGTFREIFGGGGGSGTTLAFSGTPALDAPGFAQADATDQVTGGLTALALDRTLNVALTPADAATRLAAAAPTSPAAAVFNWALTAAPGFAIASNAGPQLHAGGLLATDTTLAVTYANPFAATHAWHTVFTNVAHLDRSYTPAAGALAGKAIGLVTQVHTLREPGDGTAADNPTFDAGLPTMVTLGATPLPPSLLPSWCQAAWWVS